MTRAAIEVENLSKLYRIGLVEQGSETLVGAVADLVRSPVRNFRKLRSLTNVTTADGDDDTVIWALKDISLSVNEGQALGIIGANGAGKSTLLKVLAGITEPTGGRAVIRGRVASLLEVGTGFHPDLSGRENIYLNGTILGMKKAEIDRRFDEIVAFSGVEKFIDTPVKRFSSGMRVRLAFAVAAHLDPEVLLIDEVLAVGDLRFQEKCIGKMSEVARGGRTVLFVSHNLPAVASLCHRGVLLDQGSATFHGEMGETIAAYQRAITLKANSERLPDRQVSVEITRLLLDSADVELTPATALRFSWGLLIREPQWEVSVQLILYNSNGSFVTMPQIEPAAARALKEPGSYECQLQFPPLWLSPGAYFAKVKVFSETDTDTRRYYSDTINFLVAAENKISENEELLSPQCKWLIHDGD